MLHVTPSPKSSDLLNTSTNFIIYNAEGKVWRSSGYFSYTSYLIYSSQSIEIISGENCDPLLQPPAAEHDWIDNICDLFWGSTISLLSTVTKASVSKALRYYLMKVFSELLAYSPVVSPYREALKGFADWNGQANISLSIYQYRVEEYLSITTGTAEDVWYLEGRDHED